MTKAQIKQKYASLTTQWVDELLIIHQWIIDVWVDTCADKKLRGRRRAVKWFCWRMDRCTKK